MCSVHLSRQHAEHKHVSLKNIALGSVKEWIIKALEYRKHANARTP
jgi:hypothetical protein